MLKHRNNMSRQYWGKAAAGAVVYCPSTGRILLGKRSYWVNEPNTWGGFGGAIDPGESPEEGMLREVREEIGLSEHSIEESRLIWTFEDGAFRYYNFLCSVYEEFTPRLSSETSETLWCTLDELPYPLHFGFKALLPHLRQALSDVRENPPTDAVFVATYDQDEHEHHAIEAGELFSRSKIRLHSNYDVFLVMTESGEPEDRVVAAAAMSIYDGDDHEVEFSLAVDPTYRRQGLAKRLVEEVEQYARDLSIEFNWDAAQVSAYVVNEAAMVPLLTSMGYAASERDEYWRKSLVRKNAGSSHIPERPFSDFEGQIVACGYNLNQCSPSKSQREGEHCWAVRVLDVDSPEDVTPSKAKSTRVSGYTEGVLLKDCVFIVHEPTLRAVQNRGSKEVFAFVVGVAVNPRKVASMAADWQPVGFSPLLPPKGRGEGEFMLVSGKSRKPIKRARLFYGKDRQALVSK